MKKEILRLRNLGYTYSRIVSELGCSKSLVCYYCNDNQFNKYKSRSIKNRTKQVISKKVTNFKSEQCNKKNASNVSTFRSKIRTKIQRFNEGNLTMEFDVNYVIDRINRNPHCELTGLPIDVEDTRSWHLDHKIPVSRGGDNSIENLQILSARANQAKHNMTNEEFIELCQIILQNNGFLVSPRGIAPPSPA